MSDTPPAAAEPHSTAAELHSARADAPEASSNRDGKAGRPGGQPGDGRDAHGHVTFHITYDDTGAVVAVEAPNGWRLRQVIAEGYRQLGETQRPGDRIEADGADIAPFLDLHVKQYAERPDAPGTHFNIVSDTGGAASPTPLTRVAVGRSIVTVLRTPPSRT